MFYFIYNVASIVLFVPVLLFTLYRSVRLGWPLALPERFGYVSARELMHIAAKPVLLIHAVSVGEILAAKSMIEGLRRRYPDHAIVVSNTTETGRRTARSLPGIDLCIYFPFDYLFAVRALLQSINPVVIIIMETEIWPNFMREASKRKTPVILANGRISERSFKRYQAFGWFFSPSLNLFSRLLMQSDANRERIVAIGAPAERTTVAGNLKFDLPSRQISDEERSCQRSSYGIPEHAFVITAGSTHAGEEDLLADACKKLSESNDAIFLVLAPRHPQRAEAVVKMLREKGLVVKKRTGSENLPEQHVNVLLLDTVGELLAFYSLSDVAFVGGSLVPVGGHNLLEPASVGVPSIFGSCMANFREVTELVLAYGAGVQVADRDELAETLYNFSKSPALRKVLGQNALKLMRDSGGATERHLDEIGTYL